MATEENIIVAIELGSSKVAGAAGKKLPDGTIQVQAYTQEESGSFIQRGVVYNIDKTAQSLSSIQHKLEAQLGKKINRVYVGFGGQGLHSVHNVVTRELEADTPISQALVDEINDENGNKLTERRIFTVVPQEYVVGTQKTSDPVGILSNRIEGHYLNLVMRSSALTNMSTCFKNAGLPVVEYICTPQVLAESALTDVDKRSGCALVDLGKDTTTVAVFKNNYLRYLTVIPLGMGNVTKDLAGSLQIEESEAEQLKLKYGSAYTEITEADEHAEYKLSDGRSIGKQDFCDIVEARIEEILVNVKIQIERSGYTKDTLLDGLVLTGGGANMKDIEKAVTNYTGFDKLRLARMVDFPVTSSNATVNEKDSRKNVILGLLALGRENCCGADKTPGSLFGDDEEKDDNATGEHKEVKESNAIDKIGDEERAQREANEAQRLAEENKRKEEEERRRKEKEAREAKEKERQRKKEARRAKRKQTIKKIGTFLGNLVSPDEKD